jgi:hypothetical protein
MPHPFGFAGEPAGYSAAGLDEFLAEARKLADGRLQR